METTNFWLVSDEVFVEYVCPKCGHTATIRTEANYGQGCSLEVYDVTCEACGYEMNLDDEYDEEEED